MSTGKVLLGALAGIAIGATLGILLAPDKGSATRRKITQKGDDFAKEMGDKINDFVSKISSKYDHVKSEANRMAEDGREFVEEKADEAKTAFNRV